MCGVQHAATIPKRLVRVNSPRFERSRLACSDLDLSPLTIRRLYGYICGVAFLYLPSALHRQSLTLLLLVLLTLDGCSSVMDMGRLSDPPGIWLPLTVELHLDPTVTQAALLYLDACRKNRSLKIGEPLSKSLQRQLGRVFERVRLAPADVPVDGTVDITLGIKDLSRFIPRQATRTYSISMTLGGTVVYATAAGELLYTKNLKTEARRDVTSQESSCELNGLDTLVEETVHKLAVGLAEQLASSTKVREAAEAKAAGTLPQSTRIPGSQASHPSRTYFTLTS
jgi:hypothetical protein